MPPTKPAIDILRGQLGPRARSYAVGGGSALAGPVAVLAEQLGGRVLAAADPGDQGPRGHDACIWCEGPDEPLHPAAQQELRQHLTATGRLLVLRPRGRPEAPSPSPYAHREESPGEQLALRVTIQDLVVGLSAAGFVLLEACELGPIDCLAGDGGWTLVVARVAPLTIRGFRDGDEGAIAQLFEQSFHVRRTEDSWRWKFLAHPWGQRAISLAWDKERLCGQYAAIPMRLVRGDGSEDRALQLCDIMTAPAVRAIGRGPTAVLSRMLRHLYATHGEQRIGFVIGFNTATSRAFALRFSDGHELKPVAYWRREGWPPAHSAGPGKGYRIEAIDHFGRRFDRFFDRVAPAYDYLQRRDAAYLSWRYRQPGIDYLRLAAYRFGRLVGWSVFRRQDDELVWGDALIDPQHSGAARAFQDAATGSPLGSGITAITGWFAERPDWWRETLEGLGFERLAEPNDLSIIYGVHREPAAGSLLASLYYTKSDSDLF